MQLSPRSSMIKDMRDWIGEKSPVHAKYMSDEDILNWFKNHIHVYGDRKLHSDERVKRALDIWANYCIFEEV